MSFAIDNLCMKLRKEEVNFIQFESSMQFPSQLNMYTFWSCNLPFHLTRPTCQLVHTPQFVQVCHFILYLWLVEFHVMFRWAMALLMYSLHGKMGKWLQRDETAYKNLRICFLPLFCMLQYVTKAIYVCGFL